MMNQVISKPTTVLPPSHHEAAAHSSPPPRSEARSINAEVEISRSSSRPSSAACMDAAPAGENSINALSIQIASPEDIASSRPTGFRMPNCNDLASPRGILVSLLCASALIFSGVATMVVSRDDSGYDGEPPALVAGFSMMGAGILLAVSSGVAVLTADIARMNASHDNF